ncbi:T-cell surface antigen CD2-like isoform X2 [Plectropomus leopardus]|uniref:T-cell surface antigen CD2-like isoform X2 n=1 Tax=Plectropomus leopardus TaxID=160734 RepID=UPI001C4B78FE|nr:T-cell surface antigen CD2-like isoform X2 [Plectropomus leopardus]
MMRVVMKMAALSTISLLLLCCFISSADMCDHYAAVGKNFTVPLPHKLQNAERLIWKHNNVKILDRKPNNDFITGKREMVDEKGSLKLTNLKKADSGEYTPEVYNAAGKSQGLKLARLCVLDLVPKPTVKMTCPSTSVTFTCKVTSPTKELNFEWLQNNKVIDKTKGNTLSREAKSVEKDTFSCNVSNRVSFMISAPVTQICYKPQPILPEKLLGINTWIFVGVGGGIALVLIIVVIVCCICTKRKKRLQMKEEAELRLKWNNEQQHQLNQHNPPPDHQHRHHHHHHHQQQPAGHTGPRQHRSKQHRDQQRPRAPDQPGSFPQPSPRRPAQAPRPVDMTDDEQPPPLPQPRKKAPKTPRV